MQYSRAAGPGRHPFRVVGVDGLDGGMVLEEGVQGRLFGGLAREGALGGLGQDETDGEGRGGEVGGEGSDDVGEFDGCDGAGGGEEEVFFAVFGEGGEGG